MLNLNFISYTQLLDLALLNLIDLADLDRAQSEVFIDQEHRIHIQWKPKLKSLLKSLVMDNLSSMIYYGKTNIVLQTCDPAKNWRQSKQQDQRLKHHLKYQIADKSVFFDQLQFNKIAQSMFRDLKRADLKQMKLGTDKSKILDGISLYKDNLVLLGFEDIDMVDLVAVLKMHYTHDSHVSFMQSTCNLINDGNHDYAHDAIFSEELKNNVLINLIKEGIE